MNLPDNRIVLKIISYFFYCLLLQLMRCPTRKNILVDVPDNGKILSELLTE